MDMNILKNKYHKYKMKYLNLKKIEIIFNKPNVYNYMEQIGGKVENIIYLLTMLKRKVILATLV